MPTGVSCSTSFQGLLVLKLKLVLPLKGAKRDLLSSTDGSEVLSDHKSEADVRYFGLRP